MLTLTYDEAWTKGYRDAKNGVKEEPLGEWDSRQVQGYSHGWSVGNYRSHNNSDPIQTLVD
jgi:hypothetical protein